MKLKLLPAILAATGFLVTPFALAATYQSEISASYADIDADNTSAKDYFIDLTGKYYFSSIDTKSHPLAEAAFMEKASNIYVNLGNREIKNTGYHVDNYQRTLGVDFYIPNTILYVGAGVNEYKGKYFWAGESEVDTTKVSSNWDSTWFVKAGIAPVEGLLVWSEFTEDVDVSEAWNLNGKYLIPLAGEQALNVEASYANSDWYFPSETWRGAVDYYFDSHLSIGGGATHSTFDDQGFNQGEDVTDYFIRARNYFADNIAVELGYMDSDYESSLTLGASIRF